MRNLIRIAVLFFAFLVVTPTVSLAASPSPVPVSTPMSDEARIAMMVQRLETIKAMDKTEMSRLEKKALRKEVKEIRKEMKAVKGGVYLSIGAIIIIILLLILIL
ncbi:MAG: hypothetical protein H7Y42_03305 [Chitinophagaceae bacterium]|nr:hypothetical protein [Chitinophagaceae bacterium]